MQPFSVHYYYTALGAKKKCLFALREDIRSNPEKISGPIHNALLPMGFFLQVVMWGDTDETVLKCNIGMSSVN